jgi:hypothetical protein
VLAVGTATEAGCTRSAFNATVPPPVSPAVALPIASASPNAAAIAKRANVV